MDLNQDGVINAMDIELLSTQCTYPNCTSPATLPPYITLASPVLHSAPGQLGGLVTLTWNGVSGAKDYLVYRMALSPNETTAAPSGVSTACGGPNPPSICSQLPAAQASTTAYGFPGAPVLVTRVTNPAYSETAPNSLQALYFIRAEDSAGNLSSPSNVAGGPSLATQ
jgi:hypothetical protein